MQGTSWYDLMFRPSAQPTSWCVGSVRSISLCWSNSHRQDLSSTIRAAISDSTHPSTLPVYQTRAWRPGYRTSHRTAAVSRSLPPLYPVRGGASRPHRLARWALGAWYLARSQRPKFGSFRTANDSRPRDPSWYPWGCWRAPTYSTQDPLSRNGETFWSATRKLACRHHWRLWTFWKACL